MITIALMVLGVWVVAGLVCALLWGRLARLQDGEGS